MANIRHTIDIPQPTYDTIDKAFRSPSESSYAYQKTHIDLLCSILHTPCPPATSTSTAKLVRWLLLHVIVLLITEMVVTPVLSQPPLLKQNQYK